MRLKSLVTVGLAVVLGLAFGATTAPAASAAGARPDFQMPFPCGQVWTGNSSASSAHQSYEIDFNRGSTADADYGDTVVAAAAAPWPSRPTRARRTASATSSRSTTAAAGSPTTPT
ncbi:hypothetical protein GCM10027612_03330 [Microbispora bryophytorum subsp. camponoti]